MGGTQSVSRTIMGLMTPESRTGEFFGFFNLSGKAFSMLGPIMFTEILKRTGSANWAILSLLVFFVVGWAIIAPLNIARGQQEARQSDDSQSIPSARPAAQPASARYTRLVDCRVSPAFRYEDTFHARAHARHSPIRRSACRPSWRASIRHEIQAWADLVYEAWEHEKFIFVFGNGGSATTATHISEDLGKSSLQARAPARRNARSGSRSSA